MYTPLVENLEALIAITSIIVIFVVLFYIWYSDPFGYNTMKITPYIIDCFIEQRERTLWELWEEWSQND